jgi:hypothetical protein
MLAAVIRRHWHALVRDVLSLGRRASDMFTERLTFAEMVSIVVGAPPTSSVRHFLDGGWSREAQLIANLQEQQAGVATMKQPYARPGINERVDDPTEQQSFFHSDPYTWTEFDELERKRYANAQTPEPGTTRVRTL